MRITARALVIANLFGMALLAPPILPATSIVVTTVEDELNSDGDCSLREAISAANGDSAVDACPAGSAVDADVIRLEHATYTLTRVGIEDDNLNGDLDIIGDVEITGPSVGRATIDGGTASVGDRLLQAHSGEVVLRGLVLTGAEHDAEAGAIQVEVDATLIGHHVVVRENHASGVGPYSGGGGAFLAVGRLELYDSVVENNSGAYGGGVAVEADTHDWFKNQVILHDTTLRGNTAARDGGAFGYDWSGCAYLEVVRCRIEENLAATVFSNAGSFGSGGLKTCGLSTVIDETTIQRNTNDEMQDGEAGAVWVGAGGLVEITNSAILDNQSRRGAGVLVAELSAFPGTGTTHVRITNTTIAGNLSSPGAGGIEVRYPDSDVQVVNSSVVDNLGLPTGGVLAHEGEISFDHSILAGNLGQQCGVVNGSITSSSGYNVVSDTSCGFSEPGDLEGTDPLLDPLGDNGGPTQSYMPQAGSPAIDAYTSPHSPDRDQRGADRPFDGDGSGTAAYDIGAVEYGPQVVSTVFTDGFESDTTWAWSEP